MPAAAGPMTVLRLTGQAERVGSLIGISMQAAAIGAWLVPSDAGTGAAPHRHRVLAAFGTLIAEQGLRHGHVDVLVNSDGHWRAAAVWIDWTVPAPPVTAYEQRLERLASSGHAGFCALDQARESLRPSGPHYALAALGLSRSAFGTGCEQVLLREGIARADDAALPVAALALSPDERDHGAAAGLRAGDAHQLADGVSVWGMRRERP